MNPHPSGMSAEPRLRTIEGKIVLIAELKAAPPERAVPLLLELLCDPSWHVRERAVEAISARGGDVVEPVKALLADGLWYTRACAAEALGRIGAAEGLDALAARFTDDNPSVRKSVSAALARMAARHGARPVREALARAGTAMDSGRLVRLGAEAKELELALAAADQEARSREAHEQEAKGQETTEWGRGQDPPR